MDKFLEEIINIPPYSLKRKEKEIIYQKYFPKLIKHHKEKCESYQRIVDTLFKKEGVNNAITDKNTFIESMPFIPVRLFKDYELKSVDRSNIKKVMTSSGTSGQNVSKIFLDSENAGNQTKVLTKIINTYIGKKRLPLLILDSEYTLKDRALFSARGAGIIGFSMFGRDKCYALNESMDLDLKSIEIFLKKHQEETILMFGYTYMIWEFIVKKLEEKGVSLKIKNGLVFHVGGWKKLIEQAVNNECYKEKIKETFGNVQVHNYYGMAEQLGSVFVECEEGHLHTSIFSDVLIRNALDFSVCPLKQTGLIQLISLLPTSYPGHSILTEDMGELLGEDDCPCGRYGKYFKIHGRIKNAEVRGCSDTYEKK